MLCRGSGVASVVMGRWRESRRGESLVGGGRRSYGMGVPHNDQSCEEITGATKQTTLSVGRWQR